MDHGQFSPVEKVGAKGRMQRGLLTMAIVSAIGMSSAMAAPTSQAPPSAVGDAGMKVAEGIPSRCNTYDVSERIERDLPRIVNHSGSVSTISNVEFLTDVKRVTYSPAGGQEQELHMLQCPVRVTWDNGHQDFGYYTEWEDAQHQVRVSFAPKPMQPAEQKQ